MKLFPLYKEALDLGKDWASVNIPKGLHNSIAKLVPDLEKILNTRLKLIDTGRASSIYQTEDGEIVKITTQREANSYEKILNKKCNHICNVYKVFTHKTMGIIVKEFIPNLDKINLELVKECLQFIEDAYGDNLYQGLIKSGKNIKTYNSLKKYYPEMLEQYRELTNMALEGKNLRIPHLDITEYNIGIKHGHLIIFDPFFS